MAKSICVYCASSNGVAKEYFEEARRLGAAMAARGHALVYGGGNIGLMGELARAALAGGGRVTGVIPRAMVARGLALREATEMIVTQSMHERKAAMAARADAFIALPGGFGTLEEILETITLRQLGLHEKPCVLVNTMGYFDPSLEQFERAFRSGFTDERHRASYAVAESAAAALELVEKALGERA